MWRRVSELRSFQGQILFLTYSLTFTAGMCTKEEKKWQPISQLYEFGSRIVNLRTSRIDGSQNKIFQWRKKNQWILQMKETAVDATSLWSV